MFNNEYVFNLSLLTQRAYEMEQLAKAAHNRKLNVSFEKSSCRLSEEIITIASNLSMLGDSFSALAAKTSNVLTDARVKLDKTDTSIAEAFKNG